jgi:hypothetical protein
VWHAVQLNTSARVLSKFGLQVAGDVPFEQADSIRGRSGSIRLLNNQLSPVIEPLETARDRERQEKSYQSEYRAFDRRQPSQAAAFLPQVSQAQLPSKVQ